LFNVLFTLQHKGEFLLRIEDTDLERSSEVYTQNILEALNWLGLDYYGETIAHQSKRIEIYREYALRLFEEGKAYRCYCSQEELEAARKAQMKARKPPKYPGTCRDGRSERELGGAPYALRFKTPKEGETTFEDIVKGPARFANEELEDFVLLRSDGSPTYNLCVVVDDYEMGITHILRGEDHISNTPKQILIQEALGFPRPEYAHLPIIMGVDRSKLSKRHGAVGITEYRRQGYLREAIINFIAFLGWNPGTDKEIYSMDELLRDFSVQKIQKGGAIFNPVRLDFLNSYYIKQKNPVELAKLCVPYFVEAGFIEEENGRYKNKRTGEVIESEFLEKIALYQRARLKKLSEIAPLSEYFFTGTLGYDKELLKWKDVSAENTARALDEIYNLLSKIEMGDWTKENLEVQDYAPNSNL